MTPFHSRRWYSFLPHRRLAQMSLEREPERYPPNRSHCNVCLFDDLALVVLNCAFLGDVCESVIEIRNRVTKTGRRKGLDGSLRDESRRYNRHLSLGCTVWSILRLHRGRLRKKSLRLVRCVKNGCARG